MGRPRKNKTEPQQPGLCFVFLVLPIGEAQNIDIYVPAATYEITWPGPPDDATSWEEHGGQDRAPSSTNQSEPVIGFWLVGA